MGSFPRVDADIETFDKKVAEMDRELAKLPADPKDKGWVKKKLAHMAEVDQYLRNYINIAAEHKYSEQEKNYFFEKLDPRWTRIDSSNTRDLKELLKIHSWFKISEFGSEADQDAWLLVQHADLDPAFQKQVLAILETLYPSGETSPSHYAYLYDRVAVAEKRLQRFGTQGRCVGRRGELLPVEERQKIDERRKAVGLGPIAEYEKQIDEFCKATPL